MNYPFSPFVRIAINLNQSNMENSNQNNAGKQSNPVLNEAKRYPVEQIPNTGKPTKKQVKAAVKELNPDINSLGFRG